MANAGARENNLTLIQYSYFSHHQQLVCAMSTYPAGPGNLPGIKACQHKSTIHRVHGQTHQTEWEIDTMF